MVDDWVQAIWYGGRRALLGRALGASLTPFSWAYRAGVGIRSGLARPRAVDRPVISVGNLTVGGNGKTPLVIELVTMLQAAGRSPAVVSRGYGRRTRGTRLVRAAGGGVPDAESAGDEPALVAARCPGAALVVGEDRLDAARLAIESCRSEVIVCDDAFQHRRLARDLDLLAVHARYGFGNRRLLPAGPLREPLSALARARVIVFTHLEDETPEALARRHDLPPQATVAGCRLVPTALVSGRELLPLSGSGPRKVVAACGIAHPDDFVRSLQQYGLEVVDRLALGDHRRLGPRQLADLARRLERSRAEAVAVTEKDLVKLDPPPADLPLVGLRLQARWADGASRERIEQALHDCGALPA